MKLFISRVGRGNRRNPDLKPREPRGSFVDATEGAVRKDPF
jgi:hypothetical protein